MNRTCRLIVTPFLVALNALAILAVLCSAPAGRAQSFEAIFTDNIGRNSQAGLVQGSDGNFYGTTYAGGASGSGTVFKITPGGVLTTLVSLDSLHTGQGPTGLLAGSDGNFYGSTAGGGTSGGNGTVFKMTPGGVLTTLASFDNDTNGQSPSQLVVGNDGNFYGTTGLGGVGGGGTVFKLTPAGVLTTLANFNFTNGFSPQGGLVLGGDGNFYGTTNQGGAGGNGTVFKVTPAGVLTTLVSFNGANGASPLAGLLAGSDGNFYGTTYQGGASSQGTVFQMTPAGALTTLVSFNGANGRFPFAGLVLGSDGKFYGTTNSGGTSDSGTVFKITPAGALTTLVSFNGANGGGPAATLLAGSDGNFYGTTNAGAASDTGTVFKITPAGALTTLTTFSPTHGANPYGGLVSGSDGNFYGTTFNGGANGAGSVFMVTPGGALTTVLNFDFNFIDGANPQGGLVEGSDGNFYGTTTSGGGTVFKVTPAGTLTTLVYFYGANGAYPQDGLVLGSDGNFYGTTQGGGASNLGTVFQVTPAGALTTLVNFDGANGSYCNAGLLLGSDGNFYGTTQNGGTGDYGTVFQMTPGGALTTLVSFDNTHGAYPTARLVAGSDGKFYGTTNGGGASNYGTVFQVTSAGALTTLVSFNLTNGAFPYAGLLAGSDGNFYGTTGYGGPGTNGDAGLFGYGTVFKITPAGALTTLYSFDGTHAAFPHSTPVVGSDTNLYGTADQMVIWRVDAATRVPMLTAPASSTTTKSQIAVSFTLPEAAHTGGVKLSFGATELTLAASQESAGTHSFSFDPANPTASPEIASGSAVADGTYTVTLSYQDVAGNAAATASSTNVTVDTTAPVLSPVTIATNNVIPARAQVGNTVTLSFTTNEPIQTPSVTLLGAAVSATNVSGNLWQASAIVGAATPEGVVPFSITTTDILGNVAAPVTTTTDGIRVARDESGPTGGTFTVGPPSPVLASTTLTATFANWLDDRTPLTYDITATKFAGTTVVVKPPNHNPSATFTLPPGSYVLHGHIADAFGNETAVDVPVLVRPTTPDAATPSVVLTTPGGALTNPFSFSGTVKENVALASFSVKLNGTELTLDAPLVLTANAAVAWSVSNIVPENGPNVIVVETVDVSGNRKTMTKTLTYVNPTLALLAGTYNAVLLPTGTPDVGTTGLVMVTVTPTGAFSGKATVGGVNVPFSGVLKSDGGARFKPALGTTIDLFDNTEFQSYFGALALSVTNPAGLSGTLSTDASGSATLGNFTGQRAPYSATNHVPATPLLNLPAGPTPTKGLYTVAFPSKAQTPAMDAEDYPQGDGFATLTLTNTGNVSVAGYLADGSKFTGSAKLRADGSAPIFLQFYRKGGALAGEVTFADATHTDVSGTDFLWLRPTVPHARYYPLGWPTGVRVNAVGTKYASPGSLSFGQGAADLVHGNASLIFTGGLLGSTITDPVSVNPGPTSVGQVKLIPPTSTAYKLSISAGTGQFSGTFTHGGIVDSYRGILLNKGDNQGGFGYFLSTPALNYGASGQGGKVLLDPDGP